MATFVLLPGAGSDSWYWHLVAPFLTDAGHDVIAVDLPVDDPESGLDEYAQIAVNAIGTAKDLIVVAQSMGAYTAGLIAARLPVDLVVLVAAMTPAPWESPGDWWANTGQPEAVRAQDLREGRDPDREFDPVEVFLHDVPPEVTAASADHVRSQSERPFTQPWPLDSWPAVPTRFLLCRHDRLFPEEFQRRVVGARLGIVPDQIDSGHLPALSKPAELAARLLAYGTEVGL